MSSVTIQNVTKSFGNTVVLEDFDAVFQNGEFVTLLGPSGCGKTTLLRVIAGLEPATSGAVSVDGAPPGDARSRKRVAMVPQQPGLLPWRTVQANARLLLDVNRRANPTDALAPEALLDEVGLSEFLDVFPHELSGGMQQRVALVRALAHSRPPCPLSHCTWLASMARVASAGVL